MKISLISACSDLGVTVDGSNLGPKKLTQNVNLKNYIIEKENIEKSKDKNDLRKNIKSVNNFSKEVFDTTSEILNSNEFPLLIGGDHSTVMGSALASQKYYDNIGIIWIDAHIDYNTFDTTITGNIHGLPLAAINGLCKDLTSFFTDNYINPKNTVIVGYRAKETNADLELNNIKQTGATIFTTEDIKKYGVDNILKKAFDIANNNTNGIHISYDLDVIDPIIAKGVSVKEENGINLEETFDIMNFIVKNKGIIKSMDLVEYNPLNDIDDKTFEIANKLIDMFINEK